jgi:hypothetical protein
MYLSDLIKFSPVPNHSGDDEKHGDYFQDGVAVRDAVQHPLCGVHCDSFASVGMIQPSK